MCHLRSSTEGKQKPPIWDDVRSCGICTSTRNFYEVSATSNRSGQSWRVLRTCSAGLYVYKWSVCNLQSRLPKHEVFLFYLFYTNISSLKENLVMETIFLWEHDHLHRIVLNSLVAHISTTSNTEQKSLNESRQTERPSPLKQGA